MHALLLMQLLRVIIPQTQPYAPQGSQKRGIRQAVKVDDNRSMQKNARYSYSLWICTGDR